MPDRICALCGAPFHTNHSRKMFCSVPCSNKAKSGSEYAKRARRKYVLTHPDKIRQYRNTYARKRGLQEPWISAVRNAMHRAKYRNIPCDLTMEWAERTWTGRCAMTGIEFANRNAKPKKFALMPSIDRIVPSVGYLQSNCRFILFCVNSMKADADDITVYTVAEALLKNR